MTPEELGIDTDLKRYIYDTITRDVPNVEWAAPGEMWKDNEAWLGVRFAERGVGNADLTYLYLFGDGTVAFTPAIHTEEHWDDAWPIMLVALLALQAIRARHFVMTPNEEDA